MRVGDAVVIEKGGDIIPKVVRVILERRSPESTPFEPPRDCPACGEKLPHLEDEVRLRCVNAACPAVVRERIRHFASRNAMDIEGLGDWLVGELVNSGLVRNPADLYSLTAEQLADLKKTNEARLGERSAERIVVSLRDSKTRPLARLIYGLGIRFVGDSTAALLADRFRGVDALAAATAEELEEVDEIGARIAESVRAFFASEQNRKLLERLRDEGLRMEEEVTSEADDADLPLEGKVFVLTGLLAEMTRNEAAARIKALGGKVTGSVSSRTDFLVAGGKCGLEAPEGGEVGGRGSGPGRVRGTAGGRRSVAEPLSQGAVSRSATGA